MRRPFWLRVKIDVLKQKSPDTQTSSKFSKKPSRISITSRSTPEGLQEAFKKSTSKTPRPQRDRAPNKPNTALKAFDLGPQRRLEPGRCIPSDPARRVQLPGRTRQNPSGGDFTILVFCRSVVVVVASWRDSWHYHDCYCCNSDDSLQYCD